MMAEEQPGRYEENFKHVIERMQSQDEKIVLRAIKTARKMLMDKNIMNDSFQHSSNLQYGAVLCLELLACKQEQAKAVGKNVTIGKLVKFLRSESEFVAENSAWLLGSIVRDEKELRDEVMKCDVVEILLDIHQHQLIPLPFLQSISYLMMMVCLNAVDGDAQLNEALKLLPDIVKLLNHQDSTNLMYATCAIRNVTNSKDGITAVINAGCVPTLIRLLGSTDRLVLTLSASLDSVNKILCRSDSAVTFLKSFRPLVSKEF